MYSRCTQQALQCKALINFGFSPITLKYCIALPHRQSINVFLDERLNILLYQGVVYSRPYAWVWCFVKHVIVV